MKTRLKYLLAVALLSLAGHAPAEERTLTIEVDADATVAGTLTMPDDARGAPLVLLIAGSGPQNRDASNMIDGHAPHSQWAETLVAHGIGSFRYDERGMGTSSGEWSTTTFTQHAKDLVRIVDRLRAQPGVAENRLVLLGHSEGTLLSAAIADRVQPAAVVLMAGPATPMSAVIDDQARANTPRDGMDEAAYAQAVEKTKAAFLERARAVPSIASLLALDPRELLPSIEAPALIIQGGADEQVEAINAALIAEMLIGGGNRDVSMTVYPQLDHFLLAPDDESKRIDASVTSDTVRWIVAKTGAGSPHGSDSPACIGLKFGDTCWGKETSSGAER